MKFIMNYYFFIYIWKEIYIINMIQSQPKLCDFVSLSDTYIQVGCKCTAKSENNRELGFKNYGRKIKNS